MASPALNPHKKGEHVFNDLAGSIENAFASAVSAPKVRGLTLAARFGELSFKDLPQTSGLIDRMSRDPVLVQARTVVAPATGVHNDPNSQTYGVARMKLETALTDMVIAKAGFLWKKKPVSNGSFHEFEAIVAGVRGLISLRAGANSALDSLIDSAYDPAAEKGALTEPVSDPERRGRQAAIQAMKQHVPNLKQAAHQVVNTFFDEIDTVLEKRIAAS